MGQTYQEERETEASLTAQVIPGPADKGTSRLCDFPLDTSILYQLLSNRHVLNCISESQVWL